MNEPVFNDLKPTAIKKDGTPHYKGQIYNIKKYRARLFAYSNICAICKTTIKNVKDATLDHIIPRAHGGHTTKDNIQLAHDKCNRDKGHEL